MREQPDGNHLLDVARKTLLEQVLPLIPEDRRYGALMVANAMAIAARQLEPSQLWPAEELQRIEALLERRFDGESQAEKQVAANRALVQTVRCMALSDGETVNACDQAYASGVDAKKMRRLLEWMTMQRVLESSPKYFQSISKE